MYYSPYLSQSPQAWGKGTGIFAKPAFRAAEQKIEASLGIIIFDELLGAAAVIHMLRSPGLGV